MTNAMIVFWESIDLMEKGIIKSTGEKIVVEDPQGNKKELEMPEPIHTYAKWKSLGYQVTKGQKAIAQFKIWKHVTRKSKVEDEEDQEKMFMKKASFFSGSQVEPIPA